MFTLENTEGFTQQDLDLLNSAAQVLMDRGWDEKNAGDLVNNNFKVGRVNTIESLTVTGRETEQ